MSEFILCDRVFNEHTLRTQCGVNINNLLDDRCTRPKRVDPDTPYLVNGTGSRSDQHIQTLLARPQARQIRELSSLYGTDSVQAMSELFGSMRNELAGDISTAGLGAATTVYANRMGSFVKSVSVYQRALVDFHVAKQKKLPTVASAEQHARAAGQQMQAHFQTELGRIKSSAGRRGTPLTNVDRGLNIARSSRNVTRLNLTSAAEASRLVGFARHTKMLGNGVAVIDFGSRAGNIQNSYDAGGDWHRELFIESSSLFVSTVVGESGAIAGAAAIGFLIALTPAGWVGLVVVVGGTAVIGTTAYGAIKTNEYIKQNAGKTFDDLQNWLSR